MKKHLIQTIIVNYTMKLNINEIYKIWGIFIIDFYPVFFATYYARQFEIRTNQNKHSRITIEQYFQL